MIEINVTTEIIDILIIETIEMIEIEIEISETIETGIITIIEILEMIEITETIGINRIILLMIPESVTPVDRLDIFLGHVRNPRSRQIESRHQMTVNLIFSMA